MAEAVKARLEKDLQCSCDTSSIKIKEFKWKLVNVELDPWSAGTGLTYLSGLKRRNT